MSQQPPDEEFERRLRDVLHSRSLGVPVAPDAVDRVHAGARRRQQRRSAVAALGAVAIIGIVALSVGLGTNGHGSNVAANLHPAGPAASDLVSSSPPPAVSAAPVGS